MEDSTNDSTNILTTGLGTVANDIYSYINSLLLNPSIIILVIVIILYVVLFMSLGDSTPTSSSDEVSNSGSGTITKLVVAFFIILMIINGFQYLFGVDIVAKLKNVFTGRPQVDITVDTSRIEASKNDVPQILLRKQVFNIPKNNFVYSDAKALCSAYGARLATYKEVDEAYRDGGEWCNYGWSEGQMVLFPTQQKTFD